MGNSWKNTALWCLCKEVFVDLQYPAFIGLDQGALEAKSEAYAAVMANTWKRLTKLEMNPKLKGEDTGAQRAAVLTAM